MEEDFSEKEVLEEGTVSLDISSREKVQKKVQLLADCSRFIEEKWQFTGKISNSFRTETRKDSQLILKRIPQPVVFKSMKACYNSCSKCFYQKLWTTQGESNILDNLLWVASKMNGISPTKLGHTLRLLQTRYDDKQHRYGKLIKERVKPIIQALYLETHEKIIQEVKSFCHKKEIGATITFDGGYSSRNNNSDHAAVSFIEHTTGKKLLLHLETIKCSSQILPQTAEKILVNLKYLLSELDMMERKSKTSKKLIPLFKMIWIHGTLKRQRWLTMLFTALF